MKYKITLLCLASETNYKSSQSHYYNMHFLYWLLFFFTFLLKF